MDEPCIIRKIITSRDCRANSTKLLVRDRANIHSVQFKLQEICIVVSGLENKESNAGRTSSGLVCQ